MTFVKLPLARGAGDSSGPEVWSRARLKREFCRTGNGDRLTAAEIAQRTGLNEKTVQRIMAGECRPYFTTGARIVKVLGQSNDWLVQFLARVAPYRVKRVSRLKARRREKGTWHDVI